MEGSVFMLTLAQPADMPDDVYPKALALVQEELRVLATLFDRGVE